MAYVAVTLEYGRDKKDLALPMQVPSRLIVEGLRQVLKLNPQPGQAYFLGIQSEQGVRRIPANANLGDTGVMHGTALTLVEEKQSNTPIPQTGAYLKTVSGSSFPNHPDRAHGCQKWRFRGN
jgi:uncharacterized ubiquitin-like protein YukD